MSDTAAIFELSACMLACFMGIVVILGTIALCIFVVKKMHKRIRKTWVHGTAQLASVQELDLYRYAPGSLGLGHDQRSGQFLGLSQKQQEEHVLVTGPTGRGKTTAIILPGLLTETGQRSLFAIDPKNELHRKTSGALAQQYQIWRFAPMDAARSQHYNPLIR